MTERKRQWEVREALKAINHKLAFVTSDCPAAAVSRIHEKKYDVVDRCELSVQGRVAQVTNRHRRLILCQNPVRKHYRRQNIDERGHGSRKTITLVGTRQFF